MPDGTLTGKLALYLYTLTNLDDDTKLYLPLVVKGFTAGLN